MCGILGWVRPSFNDSKRAENEARPALESLRPRGPDTNGLQCGEGWLLGHTRLAILDLTEKAKQPMTDGRGGWLVYNGEIYNFKELREELVKKNYRFHSSGDTEVLLHAMREWGTECLPHLRGMFAFGWLDSEKRELILCRDRYGVKPLAYEAKDKEFRFASDLHALRRLPGASREIDSESAFLYMALGYVPAPHSILKNVRKVRPGCYLHVRWSNEGRLDVREFPYWSMNEIPFADPSIGQDGPKILDEFEKRIAESIRYRRVSDVSVGVLFSGGIDSTLITALCQEQNYTRVPSFTLGFNDPQSDEAPFARGLAEKLGSPHREFYIGEGDVLKIWNGLWKIYDEPFADSSALPMVALSRLVAPYVKVALSGDGGDEVFAGYPWHRALDRLNPSSAIPKFFRQIVAGIGTGLGPTLRYQTSAFGQSNRIGQWSALRTGLTDTTSKSLPVEEASKRPPPSAYFREWGKEIETIDDPLEWACRMDLLTYLPDDLMVKSDRASMSVGLELREPLLDHEVTAWCLGLPISSRFDRRTKTGKVLPRQVLKRRVPEALIDRPKQGFTPPLPSWLKGPLQPVVNETLKRFERGELSPLRLSADCARWHDCAKKLNDSHHQFLWRIVCFSEWLTHHRSLC